MLPKVKKIDRKNILARMRGNRCFQIPAGISVNLRGHLEAARYQPPTPKCTFPLAPQFYSWKPNREEAPAICAQTRACCDTCSRVCNSKLEGAGEFVHVPQSEKTWINYGAMDFSA